MSKQDVIQRKRIALLISCFSLPSIQKKRSNLQRWNDGGAGGRRKLEDAKRVGGNWHFLKKILFDLFYNFSIVGCPEPLDFVGQLQKLNK